MPIRRLIPRGQTLLDVLGDDLEAARLAELREKYPAQTEDEKLADLRWDAPISEGGRTVFVVAHDVWAMLAKDLPER